MKRYTFISAAGATLGALAGAEWYLRQRDHANNRDRWFHEGYDGSHPYNVFHNRSGWELMPGYNVAGIRINQYGFRGDDISKRKDPNVVRIMCLGDSCTFGTAGDESPYPYQLKQRLDTMDLEGDYQTINAGVEGHATINALLRLPRWLEAERLGKRRPRIGRAAAADRFFRHRRVYTNQFRIQYGAYYSDRQKRRCTGGSDHVADPYSPAQRPAVPALSR